MSDLNVARAESLEDEHQDDDENPSYIPQNDPNWRYVDEASLYSIAEDSRENSSAMQSSKATSSQQMMIIRPPSQEGVEAADVFAENEFNEETPIDLRWVTADEMAVEEGTRHTAPAPRQETDSLEDVAMEQEEEEESLGPRHNARRSLLFFLLLIGCAIVLILSITLAFRNRDDGRPRNTVSGGVVDPDFDPREDANVATPSSPSAPTTPAATSSPISSPPTSAPTFTQDPRQFVWDAVTSCPQTNPADLTNISTSQMEVFEELVYEVMALTTKVDDLVVYDPKIGVDWILEKWALLNLFFATDGEFWINNLNWYSYKDVCTWNNDAETPCTERAPGDAAITALKLRKYYYFVRLAYWHQLLAASHAFILVFDTASNNLQGFLPKELCCMPLLDELVVSGNGLEGSVPVCLYSMGLSELDLVGNTFTAQQSSESP